MCNFTYFYPLKVDWIHNGALKEFHSGKVSLEQAFELQVGRFPVINAQLTLLTRFRSVRRLSWPYHATLFTKYAVVGWYGDASGAKAPPHHREKQMIAST